MWLQCQFTVVVYQITCGYSAKNNRNSKNHARKMFKAAPLASAFCVATLGSLTYYGAFRKPSPRRVSAKSDDSPKRFKGKTVVITGAAGDIGSTTAKLFAKNGAQLVLVDLPVARERLAELCSDLRKEGAEMALYTVADMTKTEEVQGMTDFVVKNCSKIDCFFNNAGIQGQLRPIHDQDDEKFQEVLQVNVVGVFLGMKYVARAMIKGKNGGVIVNSASLAGMLGAPNMAPYTASKHAVIGMTKTAAKDLAPHGIRVCAVSPGLLEGKLWHSQVKGQAECLKALKGSDGPLTEEDLEQTERRMLDGTPLRRLGKLSEVASVVMFLCSDEASYLTGTVIPIDGGRLP